ncbi:MAG: CysB family HTH-type transcriptional regulator [Methylobacillus sp.]|jgi:LysR family cys regulon transcriptional activator|nr:CysB family HTH-type transcriptional regulator [Methylobacillus sp.]
MKLHQLRYIREVARQGLNISLAADTLHTSQPGISKQIQLLEEELDLQIFKRNGKRLIGLTEPGRIILERAEQVLREMENIKRVGEEFTRDASGSLTIATTHTQARYRLPPVVATFIEKYPDVHLTIHQGSPSQVAQQVVANEADIGIATEAMTEQPELVCLPYYQWNRCVVTPKGHPLLRDTPLTLEKITRYPIVTYDFAFTGGSLMTRTFAEKGLHPNFVLTAIDADVIKTYVSLGLGIGLLASMAYDPKRDAGLKMLDASGLFPPSTTYIAVRRDSYLRGYMYGFIQMLAPHLNRKTVDAELRQPEKG